MPMCPYGRDKKVPQDCKKCADNDPKKGCLKSIRATRKKK